MADESTGRAGRVGVRRPDLRAVPAEAEYVRHPERRERHLGGAQGGPPPLHPEGQAAQDVRRVHAKVTMNMTCQLLSDPCSHCHLEKNCDIIMIGQSINHRGVFKVQS